MTVETPKSPEEQFLNQLDQLLKQMPPDQVAAFEAKVGTAFVRRSQQMPQATTISESSTGLYISPPLDQFIRTAIADPANKKSYEPIADFFTRTEQMRAKDANIQKSVSDISAGMRNIEKLSQAEFKPGSNDEFFLQEAVEKLGDNLYDLSRALKYDQEQQYKVAVLWAQFLNSVATRYVIFVPRPGASFNGTEMSPFSGNRNDDVYGNKIGRVYSWGVRNKQGGVRFTAKVSR
ncbi:hypothetical protein HY968_05255 [Candidatus Kaiserbacteria bacterium]|nr:hypothetical protein [Candidatus Kaiserbacteria bacterium]